MPDQKSEYAAPAYPPPTDGESRPLPEGWIKQFDSNSNAWFYVDTSASPPRSIWVHPYDDPQYLERHPRSSGYDSPPSYQRSPSPPPIPSASRPNLNDKGKAPEKRGFLGKMKDKAIGTKEEREAAKRQRELEYQEQLARQRAHAAQYGAPPQMYPGQFQQYPQQAPQFQQGYGQPMYAQPARRTGGGNMALPLLGGLAGGLLLGDMLGGDGFGGGDFGGDGGFF
ncbi:hypothetical protein K439DRAFT_1641343 [Ramaria rubella]|nr:hypothetical protein K439DRAFT_1641343 [Ramaria rubella]